MPLHAVTLQVPLLGIDKGLHTEAVETVVLHQIEHVQFYNCACLYICTSKVKYEELTLFDSVGEDDNTEINLILTELEALGYIVPGDDFMIVPNYPLEGMNGFARSWKSGGKYFVVKNAAAKETWAHEFAHTKKLYHFFDVIDTDQIMSYGANRTSISNLPKRTYYGNSPSPVGGVAWQWLYFDRD